MNRQPLKHRLEAGERLLGFALTYPACEIIETVCQKFDWVWIDGQHGLWDRAAAAYAVRAADLVGTAPVIRVPGHEYGIIGPYLDLDPAGVMVPMVDTGEQAAQVVQAVRFPPLGNRSFGGRRMVDRHGRDYPAMAEATPLLIAQIETPEALENVDEIAATPGVDALLFGAADFSLRIGLPAPSAQPRPEVTQAAERIASACVKQGKSAGLVATSDAVLEQALSMGYQIMSVVTDSGILKQAAWERLAAVQKLIASKG